MGKVTGRLAKEIEDLRRMKDEEIDFTDIPEKIDWSNAVRGKFYRPLKESLTIRIDADVLAWFRAQGKGYQTRINATLREAVAGHIRRGRVRGPRSRKQ
ncbi:MAG: BrnA antitoxin family protein [Terriglobia bacterium]|jgi:uncharacterized protein (DUF4415 family)